MKHRYKLFLGGALVLATLSGYALAQSLVQTDLSGSEAWNAGQGPGGPTLGYLTSNLVRGGTAVVAATPTGAITAGSGTIAALLNGGNLIFGGQPAATVTMTTMANPADGAVLGICNGTGTAFATTTIAISANTGQTVASAVSVATLAAGVCQRIQYSRPLTTWYRIQ